MQGVKLKVKSCQKNRCSIKVQIPEKNLLKFSKGVFVSDIKKEYTGLHFPCASFAYLLSMINFYKSQNHLEKSADMSCWYFLCPSLLYFLSFSCSLFLLLFPTIFLPHCFAKHTPCPDFLHFVDHYVCAFNARLRPIIMLKVGRQCICFSITCFPLHF